MADSVLHADACRKLLVGGSEARATERLQYDRLLELIGECGALIDESSGAEVVRRDRRPAAKEGMVVSGERLCCLQLQKFGPGTYLVFFPNVEGIAGQCQGLLQIGKLLVGEPRCLS